MTDFSSLPHLPDSLTDTAARSVQKTQTAKPGGLFSRPWFLRLLAIAIIIIVWQLVALTNIRVPNIAEVIRFLIIEISEGTHGGTFKGLFWSPIGNSFMRYAIGMAIGVPIGFALGILIGTSTYARGLLNDTTLVLLALPSVVWAFLSTLWFGLTSEGPILAVVLTAAPFVAVSVSAGVRNIDRSLIEMCASYRVPLLRRTQHLILGGTLPSAITGTRLAFMAGWNSLIIVEWFGATSGVGWRARTLYNFQDYPGFTTWILLFILLIMILDRFLLRPVERRAFRWNEPPMLTFAETDDDSNASTNNSGKRLRKRQD